MINVIWEAVFKMIFNEEVDPPLTFEEVHIIQYRLDEHIEAIKARVLQMMTTTEKPPQDQSYIN